MTDAVELARKVFTLFQAGYDRFRASPGAIWTTAPLGADGLSLSLTREERGIGLNVLMEKGLVRRKTSDGYELTPEGRAACLHPELLEELLAPPRRIAPPLPNSVTISGGNVQIGNNNTQKITYQALLHETARALDKRTDLPVDQRAALAAAFREVGGFPDVEELMSPAARAAGRT